MQVGEMLVLLHRCAMWALDPEDWDNSRRVCHLEEGEPVLVLAYVPNPHVADEDGARCGLFQVVTAHGIGCINDDPQALGWTALG